MDLKGKEIKSKASGLSGQITGVEKDRLKVTFTQFQDIFVPLDKAEDLLIADDETLAEIRKLVKAMKPDKETDSKVQTYIDDYEEEEEEREEDEEADLERPLEEDDGEEEED